MLLISSSIKHREQESCVVARKPHMPQLLFSV